MAVLPCGTGAVILTLHAAVEHSTAAQGVSLAVGSTDSALYCASNTGGDTNSFANAAE